MECSSLVCNEVESLGMLAWKFCDRKCCGCSVALMVDALVVGGKGCQGAACGAW